MGIARATTWTSFLLFAACVVDESVVGADGTPPVTRISVEEILEQNLAAVRAEPRGDTITNTNKLLRIEEGGYTLTARYRATSAGKMRIDVFDGNDRVYSEGKDETGVWEWAGGDDAPSNVFHEGAAALEHGIEFNLFPLAALPDRGHDIELVGTEPIRGNDYYVLKITLSDGFETYRYVNADTWQVDLSRDFRAFHPGIDSRKQYIETRHDQWTLVDGVLFAARTRNVDLDTGEVIATTQVLESAYNRPVAELDLERSYLPDGSPQPRP